MATKTACDPTRMSIERISARTFVVLGGLFWTIAAFAGPYFFGAVGLTAALGNAFVPLAITVAALAIGWFYERLAAALLVAGALTILVIGAFMAWEPVVWLVIVGFIVVPMVISAALFGLAARMQEVCDVEAAEHPTSGAMTV